MTLFFLTGAIPLCSMLPSKTQHMYINALMKYQLHEDYMFRP